MKQLENQNEREKNEFYIFFENSVANANLFNKNNEKIGLFSTTYSIIFL